MFELPELGSDPVLNRVSTDTFSVPDEIESCNFQNLLIFGFHVAAEDLVSGRQLLLSFFYTQKKILIIN